MTPRRVAITGIGMVTSLGLTREENWTNLVNGVSGTVNMVEGTATSAADNNTTTGSVARIPNGSDTNDASTDWVLSGTPTPGDANVP